MKAAPIALKAKSTINDAIVVVMTSCRDHWQINLPAALDGRDPEGVHQVRVGLRRFRSALTLFKRFIPADQLEWLNTEAKWLANQLSPVRDLDVFLADLLARKKKGAEDAGLAALIIATKAARDAAQKRTATALRGVRMRRFTARLETWLAGHGWYADVTEAPGISTFARHTLNKRLRKISETARRAEALTTPERHALRISVKKMRYGLEFLSSVLPVKRVQRFSSLLKQLQDSLGHLNDLDVAERMIALINAKAPAASRRKIKNAETTLKAVHSKAAAKAEPETARLCHKLVKLPAL